MSTQRPIGITLVVIWFFIAGFAAAAGGALHAFTYQSVFGWFGWTGALLGTPGATAVTQTIQILLLVIGVVLIAAGLGYWVTAVGLLQAREWGRTGSIIAAAAAALAWIALGLILYFGLGPFVGGTPIFYVVIGLFNALPILYLMSNEVLSYVEGSGMPTFEGDRSTVSAQPVSTVAPPVTPALAPATAARPRMERTQFTNPSPPASAWFVARTGSRPGKEFGLRQGENMIGRDSAQCDIVLDDTTVSKQHAKVRFEAGQFILYDLGSMNGTFVNNHKIQKQGLMDGDEVRVGNIMFVFKEVKARGAR